MLKCQLINFHISTCNDLKINNHKISAISCNIILTFQIKITICIQIAA